MINVAGRERLLTEQMNRLAIESFYMKKNVKDELHQSMQEFEQNFYGQMNGNESLGLTKI